MADKDQFTFEDEDDFPASGNAKKEESPGEDTAGGEIFFDTEEDLRGTELGESPDSESSDTDSETFFFDTEEDAPEPEYAVQSEVDEPEAEETGFTGDEGLFGTALNAGFPDDEEKVDDPVDFAPEPQAKVGGSSKNRTLLMVLLLVLVGAGGAYYFMGLGSSTPSVPTVQVPAEKPAKAVSVTPPPAKAPAAKEQPVTVAVPPPPPPAPAVEKAESKPAPVPVEAKPVVAVKPAQKAAAEAPKQPSAEQPVAKVAIPTPQPVAVPEKPVAVVTKEAPKPAPVKVAETPLVKKVEATKPVEAPKQVEGGAYSLDAGSYLMESNRNALVAKIEKLGYEPLVTPVDATLDMTRLRLGTFSKDDVQASLAFARTIEPGSYSVPAGDGYVIYAGTFLKSRNLEKIKERFIAEGVMVKSEPVQVVRTLSRIRFGSFATKEDAAAAVSTVADAGLKAVVVKAK